MPICRRCTIRLLVLVLLALPASMRAQKPDSTDAWPQRAWLFFGLGPGSLRGSLAASYGGSYSPGPLIFTIRHSGADQIWFGGRIEETAFLAGYRSHGKRAFWSAQLGESAIHRAHTCDCSGGDWTGPTKSAVAFELAAQANYAVAGVGVDVFGTLQPPSRRYAGVALVVQFGWFGE